MEEITVDDRGRILIPREIRKRLGLHPGTNAQLDVEEHRLIITPPVSPEQFIQQVEGLIAEGEPTIDPLALKEIWRTREKDSEK